MPIYEGALLFLELQFDFHGNRDVREPQHVKDRLDTTTSITLNFKFTANRGRKGPRVRLLRHLRRPWWSRGRYICQGQSRLCSPPNELINYSQIPRRSRSQIQYFAFQEHLMDFIVRQKSFWGSDDESVLRAIHEGFVQTHQAMWKELGERLSCLNSPSPD